MHRLLGLGGLVAVFTLASIIGLTASCGDDNEADPTPNNPDGGPEGGEAGTITRPGNGEFFTWDECPMPAGGRFPMGDDSWSAAITLRNSPSAQDPLGEWYVPVIHAVLTKDGSVLIVGNMRAKAGPDVITGTENFLLTTEEPTADIEIRPPVIPSQHSKPTENLFCSGHAPLADGRILFISGTVPELFCGGGPITGGQPQMAAPACREVESGLAYANLYDPATKTFTRVNPDMVGGRRWYGTATRLPDNRVLVSSGQHYAFISNNHSVEVFDPAQMGKGPNGPWKLLSSEQESPKEIELTEDYTHVYVLPKPIDAAGKPRRILMMGENGDMFLFDDSLDFAGSGKDRWVNRIGRPGVRADKRAFGASGIMLSLDEKNRGRFNKGSVLVTGGSEGDMLESAHIYDPFADKWCNFGATQLNIGRHQHSTTMLPDGNILATAGHLYRGTGKGDTRVPEILNPESGTVFTGTPWPEKLLRGYHNVALLLPDGRIFIGGGLEHDGAEPDETGVWDEAVTVRYYSPPYLGPLKKGKTRPALSGGLAADKIVHYGKDLDLAYGEGPIDGIALLALGAHTHSFDMNQRRVALEYEGGKEPNGTVKVHVPTDKLLLPQGYYMLFLLKTVDGWKVPSIATIVKVDS